MRTLVGGACDSAELGQSASEVPSASESPSFSNEITTSGSSSYFWLMSWPWILQLLARSQDELAEGVLGHILDLSEPAGFPRTPWTQSCPVPCTDAASASYLRPLC